ncbi:hypothetical protein MHU86_16513 [Fragilaria crotonensis]|nr:hypothetical protein MHU86_16513 [Fragilaria crotonensis]
MLSLHTTNNNISLKVLYNHGVSDLDLSMVLPLFELMVTLILVIPVPRKIRNAITRQINRLDLGNRLGKVIIFIRIALSLALLNPFRQFSIFQPRNSSTQPQNMTASYMI